MTQDKHSNSKAPAAGTAERPPVQVVLKPRNFGNDDTETVITTVTKKNFRNNDLDTLVTVNLRHFVK